MAVGEVFPGSEQGDGVERSNPPSRQYIRHPVLRGMVSFSPDAAIELFRGAGTYADTAKARDIRKLQEETELYVATYGETQLDTEVVYEYLRNHQDAERAGRIIRLFTKAAVYMTGGYGSRTLLEQIRDQEQRGEL